MGMMIIDDDRNVVRNQENVKNLAILRWSVEVRVIRDDPKSGGQAGEIPYV
jgi:hypothetical protein